MKYWGFIEVLVSVLILLLGLFCHQTESGSVSLTSENFDRSVAQHELVFLNFYADWCRFSQMLAPVFDEAAEKLTKEYPPGRVLFGKVDCDRETNLGGRFRITKYPTLKFIRNGKIVKREYRGQRSLEALMDHIRELLKDPVIEIKDPADLEKLEENKRIMVAYLSSKQSQMYEVFKKVSMDLRDDCQFYVSVSIGTDAQGGNKIIFKPSKSKLGQNDEVYGGSLLNYEEFSPWATERCIPLVREITFENAEELTEEGLPFLILFHHPDDKESVVAFTREVEKQILEDRSSINFLIADGIKFSHPLHHLGKTSRDLPLIAIDSFRHMYLFPKFSDINIPGKLKQFVLDLHSGKLHREFHYGPDPTTDSLAHISTDPPESTFRKLAPSRNRYTLLRDEL